MASETFFPATCHKVWSKPIDFLWNIQNTYNPRDTENLKLNNILFYGRQRVVAEPANRGRAHLN